MNTKEAKTCSLKPLAGGFRMFELASEIEETCLESFKVKLFERSQHREQAVEIRGIDLPRIRLTADVYPITDSRREQAAGNRTQEFPAR